MPATQPPCDTCRALCCRHVAMEIDRPTCKRDYDNIIWYLLHDKVHVFVDHEGDWMVEFETPCRNLRQDFRCGDYENRPRMCREYPDPDNHCEFEGRGNPYYRHHFSRPEEFISYLERRGIDWQWKRRIR